MEDDNALTEQVEELSLLERAKNLAPIIRVKPGQDGEEDLAIAWLIGEITLTQVIRTLHLNPPYAFLAVRIKGAVKRGRLKVALSEDKKE